MTTRSARIAVKAPLPVVRQILLEAAALAEWNPAFLSVAAPRTAAAEQRYPIRVRGGLKGFLEYRRITPTLVVAHWEVPGLMEDHSWELRAGDDRTHVEHTFEHSGPLALVLRRAFANVAELRLLRLAERAQGRAVARGA